MTDDARPSEDRLREALYKVAGGVTDARVAELMRAAAIPLHGHPISNEAGYVAALIRSQIVQGIDAALAASRPAPDRNPTHLTTEDILAASRPAPDTRTEALVDALHRMSLSHPPSPEGMICGYCADLADHIVAALSPSKGSDPVADSLRDIINVGRNEADDIADAKAEAEFLKPIK